MEKITCIISSLCSEKACPILKRCVYSVSKSASKVRVELRVVVVTNGEHLSLRGVRKNIDLLVRVKNPYSFAKMNNIAIDKALVKFDPNWILLMNDDAYVKDTFFKYFLQAVSNKKTDFVVPLVYNHEGSVIDSFGVEYFCSGHPKNSTNIKIKTQLAAAACLLINTNLLKEMKSKFGFYFNNFLISYLEDVEFSIRAMAIGAKTLKVKDMITYHEVSYTNGKKSNYVMYQSFRNLIWIIIMTWPFKIIIKNIFNIIMVQGLMFVLSVRMLNPWLYIKIWPITIKKLPNLLKLRKKIISAYPKDFKFEKILSPYAFRTNHNVKIKFLNIV
jgi:GT2 family glycosyltransferase